MNAIMNPRGLQPATFIEAVRKESHQMEPIPEEEERGNDDD